MKYILFSFCSIAAITLSSCSLFHNKSEEAISLKIDTATALKGRTVSSHISIIDSEKAEIIK